MVKTIFKSYRILRKSFDSKHYGWQEGEEEIHSLGRIWAPCPVALSIHRATAVFQSLSLFLTFFLLLLLHDGH